MDSLTFLATDIDGSIIAVIAVCGGMGIAVISIIANAIKSVCWRKEAEQSRREIAAYIAEGSMSPDEGERLLNAGPKQPKSCC